MNIEEFNNFKEKTIAEFHVAIIKTENMFLDKMKKKDVIGALEAMKYKIKLENLLAKKMRDGNKNNYKGHKKGL